MNVNVMKTPAAPEQIGRFKVPLLALLLCLLALSAVAFAQSATVASSTVSEIRAFFERAGKTVLTFVGYSGAGYEDPVAMLAEAERVLSESDPNKTIVNIGATPDGIGAIYEIAKRKGFVTTGIVSAQARQYNVALSPYIDHVFFVEDATWGGYLKGTERLSPTSEAIVQTSDVVIGIGGGEVARDELTAARRLGKEGAVHPSRYESPKGPRSRSAQGTRSTDGFPRGGARSVLER
jgi:hypothetical protein